MQKKTILQTTVTTELHNLAKIDTLMNIYRGRPAHLPDDSDDRDSLGLDDEPIVIVQLLNRVQDGTRCRTGSLDMCIQGKCQVNVHLLLIYFNLITNFLLHCMLIMCLCFVFNFKSSKIQFNLAQ